MIIHLTSFFTLHKNTPANIAKKRLKIIVSKHQSHRKITQNYLLQLKQDIINIICKYPQINSKTISLQINNKNDNISTLELNITLNEVNKKISTIENNQKSTATNARLK